MNFELVIGKMDVFRQAGFQGCVHQIMRDVSEESAFRFQEFDRAQRFFDGGMGGMGIVAECVEEENIEAG